MKKREPCKGETMQGELKGAAWDVWLVRPGWAFGSAPARRAVSRAQESPWRHPGRVKASLLTPEANASSYQEESSRKS